MYLHVSWSLAASALATVVPILYRFFAQFVTLQKQVHSPPAAHRDRCEEISVVCKPVNMLFDNYPLLRPAETEHVPAWRRVWGFNGGPQTPHLRAFENGFETTPSHSIGENGHEKDHFGSNICP